MRAPWVRAKRVEFVREFAAGQEPFDAAAPEAAEAFLFRQSILARFSKENACFSKPLQGFLWRF